MASYIELTKGKTAIVDDCFFEELRKYKWCANKAHKTWYAVRKPPRCGGNPHFIYMHHEVLRLGGVERLPHTDHHDNNGLNNQLDNLRPSTHSQNLFNRGLDRNNTSGFKGVSFYKRVGKWRARIWCNRKCHYLGNFSTPEEAADAYDAAAIRLHGEFARTNKAIHETNRINPNTACA